MTDFSDEKFNAGQALWNQRLELDKVRSRLEGLAGAVGQLSDSSLVQYAQLFAIIKEFHPDRIIEVGRGRGNSTCVLTEAANRLGDVKVVSVCLSDEWQKISLPRVRSVVPPGWEDRLDARVDNLINLDMEKEIGSGKRILFLWDAHGWDLAEYILGVVMPLIADKPHLVLVHDICNNEHFPLEDRQYKGKGIWKGAYNDNSGQFVFINSMLSRFEELIAIVDFASRNHLELHSVETEIRQVIDADPARRAEMLRLLGDQMYSLDTSFYWFSLNSLKAGTPFAFPRYERPQVSDLSGNTNTPSPQEIIAIRVAQDYGRYNWHGHPTLATYGLIAAKMLLGRYR